MTAVELTVLFYFALIFIYEWEDGNLSISTTTLAIGGMFATIMHPNGASEIVVTSLELLCARLNFKTVNIEGTA